MTPEIDERNETYPFTPAELERLYAFKQAVLAGFYTDQLPDAETPQVARGFNSDQPARPTSDS